MPDTIAAAVALAASVGYEGSTMNVAFRMGSTTAPSAPVLRGIVDVVLDAVSSAERPAGVETLSPSVRTPRADQVRRPEDSVSSPVEESPAE